MAQRRWPQSTPPGSPATRPAAARAALARRVVTGIHDSSSGGADWFGSHPRPRRNLRSRAPFIGMVRAPPPSHPRGSGPDHRAMPHRSTSPRPGPSGHSVPREERGSVVYDLVRATCVNQSCRPFYRVGPVALGSCLIDRPPILGVAPALPGAPGRWRGSVRCDVRRMQRVGCVRLAASHRQQERAAPPL